ncbi:ABC transporter ATP-binding protein [Plantibacter sp. Mn2098]|uniref:ABC transporter ATP-binding protein n=1 Tax=Plantibacter sp. Mn2098 TaxID=3395266 RepID=UPI003BED1C13
MIRQLALILGPVEGRKLRVYLGWLLASAVLQGLAVTALVLVLSAMLDARFDEGWAWLGVMAVAVLVASIASYGQAMRGFRVALALLRTLQNRIGDHVATLPLGWFQTERIGRLSRIVTNGTMNLGSLPAHLLTPLVTGIVTPATVVVCLLFLDWRIGVAALLTAPLLALAFWWSSRLIERGDRLVDAASAEVGERVVEYARTMRVLRAFGGTGRVYEPLERSLAEHGRSRAAMLRTVVPGTLLVGLTVQFAFSVVIITGASLALGAAVEPATVIASLVLAARFTGPLAEVGDLMGAVRMARADLARITAVLEEQPLPAPAVDAAAPDGDAPDAGAVAPGDVEFRDVGFGYPGGDRVIGSVSFTAKQGSLVALVGPSGVGKSTLLSLVPRFADVGSGAVLIGGVDIRDLTTETVMDAVAMVFQDVYLFDQTLEESVRVGRPDASETQWRRAARHAGVDEIAARLSEGWDAPVGEGGTAAVRR